MKIRRLYCVIFALTAVFGISAFAKTHKADIVAIDTIEYTLEEDDKLAAELFIENDGLYYINITDLSTTGSFKPNISVSVSDRVTKLLDVTTDNPFLEDGSFDSEKFKFLICLTEGEYKLEVENLTKFSDVTFKIETDFTEEENIENPNSANFESATEISLGTKYFGSASMSAEKDFYLFEMPYDGYAFIDMYSPKLKHFTLYDKAGNEIGTAGIEIDESDKVYEIRTGLAKGIYYISVTPEDDYSLPLYTLQVTAYKSDSFEKEYNNQKEFANVLTQNKEYQGNLFSHTDEDVYSFTLSENSGVIIDFTDTHVSKDGHYSLWVSDGENVVFESDECGREAIALNLDKGTYYISVGGLGYSRFTDMGYKLRVSADKSIAICPPEEDSGVGENEPSHPSEPDAEEVVPFDDVKESDWYYDDIMEAKELGLIDGVGNNMYNPKGNVTLAEVITMAARIKNNLGGANTPLEDSPVGKWYNSYITFAVNVGIINSKDFDNFEKTATRAEVAYIFSNLFSNIETEKNTIIPDVDENVKYCDSIHKLYALGILKGDDEKGTFYPERNLSRAEAAVILLRVHYTK